MLKNVVEKELVLEFLSVMAQHNSNTVSKKPVRHSNPFNPASKRRTLTTKSYGGTRLYSTVNSFIVSDGNC